MRRSLLVATFCLLSARALAAPQPNDFAYGEEMTPLHQATFHRAVLPEVVLRAVTSRDLADVCVFDAKGTPRAHSIVWPEAPAPATSDVPLALFPLEISEQTEGVEVKVERDESGQILRTLSQPLVQRDARVRAYLLDAHALVGSLRALTLTLKGARDATMLEVRIEASPDLGHFSELARTTIANLAHDGQTLSYDTVKLPDSEPAYLRLSFDPGPNQLALEKVSAQLATEPAPLERTTLVLDATPGESEHAAPQQFRFLVPHGLRAERYAVLLPQGNALAQGELFGGDAEDAPLLALDRQVYRTPASKYPLPQSRARVLELRVDEAGGGIRSGAPKLELSYVAPELLFAGDGEAPFMLAYGSASAHCKQINGDTLKLEASATASVKLTAHKTLGGAAQTRASADTSLRVYVLWAALLVAVSVLGLIARRLLRSV